MNLSPTSWGFPAITRALRWNLCIRAIGLTFACAFASLAVQNPGLIGSQGISPAADLVHRAGQALGSDRLFLFPTLFWLDASDSFLLGAAWSGVLVGVVVACGLVPRWGLLALWAIYLSFATVCVEFLAFQWDNLLLEAGLLAAAAAPAGARLRGRDGAAAPPAIMDFVLSMLLLRVVFFSGFVKLASGDPTWRDLTALQYHFETQPLATWTSWWVHHAPRGLLRTGCAVAIGVELLCPVLLFLGRRARTAGAFGIVALQIAFAATGNFGFFNLLTAVLCIPFLGMHFGERVDTRRWWGARRIVAGAYAFVALWIGGWSSLERLAGRPAPGPVRTTLAWAAPFRSFEDYGLFAVMTTSRPEIVIETSADGSTWQELPFRWKPGDLGRKPAFTGPHMPRLDWQMWFAALEAQDRGAPPAWVGRFARRILQGSPALRSILPPDAFGPAPPRFLRARLDVYRFTSPQERRASGDWWARRTIQPLTPVLSLE
jgi:hypothetical protein